VKTKPNPLLAQASAKAAQELRRANSDDLDNQKSGDDQDWETVHFGFELSKVHDEQLFAFIHTLMKRPEDVAQVVSDFTNVHKNFFVFNMYFEVRKYVQQYLVAVDDFVLLSSDGTNLFCQFDKGVNVLLPLLEKSWDKYVYLGEIRKSLCGKRYIEKVLLAYLGAPCIKLSTKSRWFFDRFSASWFKGSYSYCYLASSEKEEKNRPYSSFIPILIVDFIQTRRIVNAFEAGAAASDENQETVYLFVLQVYDDSNIKSQAFIQNYSDYEATKHLTGAADSHQESFLYIEASKFCETFDEVFICTYRRDRKVNHFNIGTSGVSSLETNRFEELFLSFKACINDEVSITITQNHSFVKDKTDNSELSSKIHENNPPIRVVLARKAIFKNVFDLKNKEILETKLANLKEKGEIELTSLMHQLNFKGVETILKPRKTGGTNAQMDLNSDYDSSGEEESKNKDQNAMQQQEQRKLIEDPNNIFSKLADAAENARKGQLNTEVTEDLIYEDLFKKVTRDYRNDMKYVCGFGQTREEVIHLR